MHTVQDIVRANGYGLANTEGAAISWPLPDALKFWIIKKRRRTPLFGMIRRRTLHWRVAHVTEDKGRWKMLVYGRTFLPEMKQLAGSIRRDTQTHCIVFLGAELPHPVTLRPDFTTG